MLASDDGSGTRSSSLVTKNFSLDPSVFYVLPQKADDHRVDPVGHSCQQELFIHVFSFRGVTPPPAQDNLQLPISATILLLPM